LATARSTVFEWAAAADGEWSSAAAAAIRSPDFETHWPRAELRGSQRSAAVNDNRVRVTHSLSLTLDNAGQKTARFAATINNPGAAKIRKQYPLANPSANGPLQTA